MSARWCEQHQRPECTEVRRYTAEPCHNQPGKGHDACAHHRAVPGDHYTDAHGEVRAAVTAGVLVKPETCEMCGTRPPKRAGLHAHHEDYGKPLDVTWLCGSCHGRVHGPGLAARTAWLRTCLDGAERILGRREQATQSAS